MLIGIEDYATITCLVYCVSRNARKCREEADKRKTYYDCLAERCRYCAEVGDDVAIVYDKINS